MGNTETKTLTVKESDEINKKLEKLYSVVLEYLIIKKSLTNDIKTQSFMKGYKNERCTREDDKEECEKGITYKEDATALIKTKTGKQRKQAVNNFLKYFGHDRSDDFVKDKIVEDDFVKDKIVEDDFVEIDDTELQIDRLIADLYRLQSKFKHAKKKSIKKVKMKSINKSKTIKNKKVKSINKSKNKSKPKRVL